MVSVGLCMVGGCQFVAALWNKMQWKPRWNTAHYEEYYRAMQLHPTLPHITLHCITVLLASPTPRPGAALVGASSLGQVAALDSLVHWNFCNSRGSTLHHRCCVSFALHCVKHWSVAERWWVGCKYWKAGCTHPWSGCSLGSLQTSPWWEIFFWHREQRKSEFQRFEWSKPWSAISSFKTQPLTAFCSKLQIWALTIYNDACLLFTTVWTFEHALPRIGGDGSGQPHRPPGPLRGQAGRHRNAELVIFNVEESWIVYSVHTAALVLSVGTQWVAKLPDIWWKHVNAHLN